MINTQVIHTNNLLTKSKLPDADYVINPYLGCTHKCIYCYAEFVKRFSNHKEPWGDFLDVKICSKNINIKTLSGKTVLISSVTDPYNPYEKKYMATRNILNQLIESDARVELLTKSSLILRDIDIIKKLKYVKVGISLNTLDDDLRKNIEPFASTVEERLKALKVIKENGIETYLFVAPIFPKLTDFKQIVNHLGSTVDCYCFENLNLRGEYKIKTLKFIASYKSELSPLYDEIYNNNDISYWEELRDDIENEFKVNNFNHKIYFYHDKIKKK